MSVPVTRVQGMKPQLSKLFEDQGGIISRRQALDAQITPRMISHRLSTGQWKVVFPSIYQMASVRLTPHARLLAAWLWGGDGAIASHRGAAYLHGLDGVEEPVADLYLPRATRSPNSFIVVHRTGNLRRGQTEMARGMRITRPTRTLLDLGSVLSEESLELAVESALRMGLTSVASLRRLLHEFDGSRRPGPSRLRRLIRSRGGGAPSESPLEVRTFRLLRNNGVPPVRQHPVTLLAGDAVRIDLAYPEERLAIECDSLRFHTGRERMQRDVRKQNGLSAKGWRMLRVTWWDLKERPDEFVAEVKALLAAGRQDPPLAAPQ